MKYALFEFQDEGNGTAIEVGESCWIEEFDPSEVDGWDFTETVIVNWPSAGSSNSNLSAQQFAVRVIAFSDSRHYLITKRNEIDKGDMEPESSCLGRGQRKKTPKRFATEIELREKVTEPKKKKKTKDPLPLQKASSMAAALKEKIFQNPMELQADSQTKLKELRGRLKRCEEEKREVLESIKFVKELPKFIGAMEKLVERAEAVTLLLQQQINIPRGVQPNGERGEKSPRQPCKDITVSRSSEIDSKMVERCNCTDFRKFTSDLLVVVFGRNTLATHSLTGGKAIKGEGIQKDALDQEKVADLIKTVQKKFPDVNRELIKLSIITKLNNESKLLKRRNATAEC